ncbi:hypothetical protein G6F46_000653 [Rhizopus delemar]|uniref:Sister chromatid cohesion protein DCC1 n=2 Tax=Rhizopus TaxID=4842 RepID=A0A9P6YS27_9FUNG|nr:hypothetical protein G6F55_011656 [Rhizopus delemar]KAG1534529.1 hypothetical protein G6F51_012044 [Rhizopus arrhizus]KAG1488961.1 hypothetical protein G6F54_011783 [Rhizopus delemar]KAG1497756.1 hypothetical protein G6F53_011896 [Rhizopus delemar]KAG1510730.1 hypothetical protein G6F52_010826 [Rhizopus delemar]
MEPLKLSFSKNFVKDSFKLIELSTPEQIQAFESGNTLVIKGLEDDEAVLCTEYKTFAIRQMHISNSVLLVNKDEDCYLARDNVSSTIDLQPCLARLGRIDGLLSGTCYEGESNEENTKSKTFYTFEELLSIVQASEKELRKGLEERGVFEYKGYCRTFEKTWLFRLFDSFITNALVHTLDIQNITLDIAKDCVMEEKEAIGEDEYIPDEIMKAAFSVFAIIRDDNVLKFDEVKICRFLGEWLLSNPRDKKWRLEEFLQVWKTLGHDIFIPKLEYIDGLFITEERIKMQQKEQHIRYFPASELSTDAAKRFFTLFQAKERWTLEEITPFLMDLAPMEKERESLLFKFARISRVGNTVYYTSRIK